MPHSTTVDFGLMKWSQGNKTHIYSIYPRTYLEGEVWFCEGPGLKKETSKLWLLPKAGQMRWLDIRVFL